MIKLQKIYADKRTSLIRLIRRAVVVLWFHG